MSDEIPVLTLHQPWATLIALGAKTVETRGWPTKYRGPIAIHAGLARPPQMHLPKLWSLGSTRDEQNQWNRQTWLCIETITDPAFQGPQPTGRRFPKRALTPTLFFPHDGPWKRIDPETGYARTLHLPLGAIVAVADVVDCVPTEHIAREHPGGGTWPYTPPILARISVFEDAFGDYRRGRYGWKLDNLRPLDRPVPFRGGQGLSRRISLSALLG